MCSRAVVVYSHWKGKRWAARFLQKAWVQGTLASHLSYPSSLHSREHHLGLRNPGMNIALENLLGRP